LTKNSMEKFYYMVRITFMTKFAYIKAFWFNFFSTAVSILIYYFLWIHVFNGMNDLNGFTSAEITTYVVLSRILASQFSGGINKEFAEWIYKGNIVVELLRPVNIMFILFGKRMGEFFFFLIFKGIPISLIGMLFLKGVAPYTITQFLLFLICIFISIVMMFWIEVMVGLIAFFTFNSYGVASTKGVLLSILSGGVVPLFLFPEGIAKCLDYLPFAGMVSVPINIYLNKYNMHQVTLYICLQIMWSIILGIIAILFYKVAIKKVVIQGG
jgi:ABC-2 type transport system permease protein